MANLNEQNARLASKRRQSNRYRGILAVLGCAVVVVTAAVLMMPAISMSKGELTCGFEEHAHGDACYSQVLTCGQQETEGHAHTDACYENVLVCDEEDPDHVHTDACYEKQLTCGQEESKGHTHSDACYEKQLTCDTPEHTHTDACYTHVQANEEKTVAKAEDSSEAAEPAKGEQPAKAEESAKSSSSNATSKEATGKSASAAASTSSASASSAAASKAEAKMPAVDFEKDIKRNNEPDIKVIVKAPEGAFPEGTTMEAKLIAANDVQSKVEAAIERETGEEAKVKSITAVDIVFKDKDGKEIEPAKKVEVKITSDEVRDIDNPMLVHVLDKAKDSSKGKSVDAEIVGGVKIVDDDATGAEDNTMKFESEAFSPYVIVELEDGDVDPETGARTINVSNEDAGYSITVNIPAEAGIPSDARLSVEELLQPSRAWTSHVDVLEEQMGAKISYARLFDITILDAGDNEIQPAVPVEVKITLDDAADLSDSMTVAHFASEDEVEFVDANLSGDTVSFDAEGFSVYAVVDGSTDDYARMTVQFYNGENMITEMRVKNGDSAEALETILYDPGAGTVPPGQVFIGWILDKPDFTTADLNDVMTIDQIRTWAESKQITEGEKHKFYAAICKLYTVTYKDSAEDEEGDSGDNVVLGVTAVPVKASEYGTVEVPFTVNMAYTPKDDIHNFEGWKADEGSVSNITSTVPADRIFQNGDPITIKGDVGFTVNAPKGNWLVFDENGKGGTYNAPQFVRWGDAPSETYNTMQRNGYSFGGWYTEVAEQADQNGYKPVVEGTEFNFSEALTAKKTVYAKWIPNTTAPYTVVFYTQNAARTGYDLKESVTVQGGTVGQNIPYTLVNNGDEDYVRVNGTEYHYTGFNAKQPTTEVVINPEGTATLNVYFDRIEYKVRFYLYRKGTGNNSYQYARNSAGGNNIWGIADWYGATSLADMPTTTYPGGIKSKAGVDGYTGYYFELDAYYGEDISAKWPTYSQISGPASDRQPVSYIMMVGTRMKPRPSSGGDGTVKGIITTLDEGILGATNDADGNFLIVRFNSYNNWTYHLYYEPYEGQDLTGKTTREFNGKTYYWDHDVTSRSSNTIPASQNAPEYTGFVTVRGSDNKALYDQVYIDGVLNGTPQANSVSGHDAQLNYYYDRLKYEINYMDGTYFDANNQPQAVPAKEAPLHTSESIDFDASVSEYGDVTSDKYYAPSSSDANADGYVFEGWYADAACNVPMEWTKMPIGGIKVYAKWRKVQYRVFMHPNAGTDESLDWGSDTVSMSFRVDYKGQVSTPRGTREGSGYEFVGWYTDPNFSSASMYRPDTELNDSVTVDYDKSEATELDKWGNPLKSGDDYVDDQGRVLTPTWNKDFNNDRFWITKKLELYAKWRKALAGDGISVEYWPTDNDDPSHTGTNPPVDRALYPDQADAIAQAALTAPDGVEFKCWVMQKWDEDQGEYVDVEGGELLPGQHFTIEESYARKRAIEGETDKYTYTIRLRAEYSKSESELPTHIWWFNNYSDNGADRHDSFHQDEGISINEDVGIQSAPTREGYVFLGWARVDAEVSESAVGVDGNPPTGNVLDLDESDLYLAYVDGGYKLADQTSAYYGRAVTRVAADEEHPYMDMYAVWEKAKYSVTVVKELDSAESEAQTFEFTQNGLDEFINASNPSDFSLTIAAEGTSAETTFVNGDGEKAIVPYETEFSITEKDKEGFQIKQVTATYIDAEGQPQPYANVGSGSEIKLLGNTTITFTNERAVVDVTVKKTLVNPFIESDTFNFTATDADMEGSPKSFQISASNDAVGEYVIEDVPIGSKMAITEAADVEYSYTVEANGVTGGTQSGSTYEFTVPSEDATVTFTNTVVTADELNAVKTDDKTPATPLSGATFTLTRNERLDGKSDHFIPIVGFENAITTDGDGTILSSATLPAGVYKLTESAAPSGYVVENGEVVFNVGADGKITLSSPAPVNASVSADGKTLTITNKAGKPLPNTGGAGTLPYTLGGIALVVIAACMYGFGSRRNRERGSRG